MLRFKLPLVHPKALWRCEFQSGPGILHSQQKKPSSSAGPTGFGISGIFEISWILEVFWDLLLLHLRDLRDLRGIRAA